MLCELLEQLKNENISQRQFITIIKKSNDLINEVNEKTNFLNEYDVDILERLYYVINDIHEVVKCKYCGNKAIFTGRINEGYKEICSNKDCRTKQLGDSHKGSTKISNNRDKEFIKWQKSLSYIDDNIIKEKFNYDKYIELIDNKIIINYLKNRYKDSDSLLETVQRIKFDIEEKPKCPTCGKPVNWIGKKSKLYTTYCSNKCAGSNTETIIKKKQTQLEHWGTVNCYDSEKYKNLYKEKYGVEYAFQREDIKQKRRDMLIERYGVEHPNQNQKIMDKVWQTCKEHMSFSKSSEEDEIYNWLIELNYNIERQYKSIEYPYHCDFYLKDFDVYIEYQGSQFHNYKAFLNTEEDKNELNKLQEIVNKKIEEGKNPQAKAIIETWTIRDVNKRNFALEHNINLLEIYQCRSKEELKKQLDVYFYFFNKPDNIFKNNPIECRRIIQYLCKKLNKKEFELTVDDIEDYLINNI